MCSYYCYAWNHVPVVHWKHWLFTLTLSFNNVWSFVWSYAPVGVYSTVVNGLHWLICPGFVHAHAARGHQLRVSAAGLQGHRRGDVASCLWRLQCLHFCIWPDRCWQIIYHDGQTRKGPARNNPTGKGYVHNQTIIISMSTWEFTCLLMYYNEQTLLFAQYHNDH